MALDTQSRIELAREHYRQNRLAEAEALTGDVLTLEPLNIPARLITGAICFRTGRTNEAERLLGSILDQEPNHVDAIGLLAVIKRATRDPGGAAELFQRLVKQGSESAEIYNQLGACHLDA